MRENLIKRKVSGGARTRLGTYSWDVGLTLVNTCRKLKISFYKYLKDRYSKAHNISSSNILFKLFKPPDIDQAQRNLSFFQTLSI
jgi:hypothetical protein